MIYKSKETGELLTRKYMLKAMAEIYKNPEPDELAIMQHFLLVLENWEKGEVVITSHLDSYLKDNVEAQKEVKKAFERYCVYDWGDTSINDQEANDRAILTKEERILASYHLKSLDREIWIITEWDRSYTTLLFPEDY